MPATYVVGAVFLLVSDFSLFSCSLTVALFWTLGLLSLYLIGRILFTWNRYIPALMPAVFLAIPSFWEIGFSYNLESGLFAATAVILTFLAYANKMGTRYFALALVLISFLVLSKAVLVLHIIPAGLFLVLVQKEGRKKPLIILLTVILVSSLWLISRYSKVGVELTVDYMGTTANVNPRLYYTDLILKTFHSIPLLAGSVLFLILLIRKKEIPFLCLPYIALFLSPFIFYTFVISTKHPWYILPGYIAFPALFLIMAQRLWEKKYVSIPVIAALLFYSFLAIRNISIVAANSVPGGIVHKRIEGLRLAVPPTDIENILAAKIIGDIQNDPKMTSAIDLSKTQLSSKRLMLIALSKEPRIFFESQLIITDRILDNFRLFTEALPERTRVYAIGEEWPRVSPGLFCDKPNLKYLNYLSDALEGERENFKLMGTQKLPEGLTLTVFENRFPEKTYAGNGLLLYEPISNNIHDLKTSGDWEGALEKIEKARAVAHPINQAGINLEHGLILEKLNRLDEAEKILEKTFSNQLASSLQTGDTFLIMARIADKKGKTNKSQELFENALAHDVTPGLLADSAAMLSISTKSNYNDIRNAISLLEKSFGKARGANLGKIRISIGKLAMKIGDYEYALEVFSKAKEEVTDGSTIKWLEDSILEINSIK